MYRDTDYLNYNDLNKVENELKQENEKLTKLNPSTPTFSSKEWKENDFPYIQEIDRIERGVNELAKNYYEPEGWQECKTWLEGNETSQVIKSFSYKDINRWINNYNLIKEKLDTYKTKIIKGTRIEINSVKNQNSSKFTIYGASEQETRSGKNLLENKTKNSGTSNGITFTLNDNGSYTIRGTNDNNGNSAVFLSSSSNKTVLKAGTYYTIPTGLSGVLMVGYTGSKYINLSTISSGTFTLEEDTQMQVYVQVYKGITKTFNGEIVYPMISTTPITVDDYEPYGAMPSPDYPSEIKTVGIKNLFDLDLNKKFQTSRVKVTEIKDGFRLDFTQTTGLQYTSFKLENYENLLNKKISLNCISKGNHNPKVKVYGCTETGGLSSLYSEFPKANGGTITLPSALKSGDVGLALVFYIDGGRATTDGYAEYTNIMLEEGEISHNYVPYGNWLRLDNYSRNKFKTVEKNKTLTKNGITITINDDYTITMNGTGTANTWVEFICKFDGTTSEATTIPIVKLDNTKTYSILRKGISGTSTGTNNVVIVSDINNTQLTFSSTKIEPVISKNIDGLYRGWLRYGANTTCNNYTFSMQIEEGKTVGEYEPYRDDVTYINLDKENLFDKNKINKINAYFETSGNIISNVNNRVIYIECLPNTNYLIEQGISTLSNHLLDIATTNILPNEGVEINNVSRMGNNKTQIYTTNNTAKYLIFRIRSGDDVDSYYSNFKIYNGTTPYYELCSIDDVRNELEVVSGKGIQRIGKYVFNGSENWVLGNTLTNTIDFRINENIGAKITGGNHTLGLCSHLVGEPNGASVDKECFWFNQNGYIRLRVNKTIASTVANFKTWLSNNPVTLYYILNEEQPFEIEPTNIKLFEGYNNIELLTDVDTEMECEYIYEIGDKTTIWNLMSFIEWNKESEIEWSDL